MSGKPSLQVRSVSLREPMQDHMSALRAISFVRRILVGVLLLALLLPIAVFGGVVAGVLPLDDAAPPAADESTLATADRPDSDAASEWSVRAVAAARVGFEVAAPLVRGLALLLVAVHFLAANVCLCGRLGGANYAVRGFFWAVLLVLVVMPVSQIIGVALPAVYYDLGALRDSCAPPPEGTMATVRHCVRFLAMPLAALLIALIADSRFGRCYEAVLRRIQQELEINVH